MLEFEEGRSQVRRLSGLQGEFTASLDNLLRPSLRMWYMEAEHYTHNMKNTWRRRRNEEGGPVDQGTEEGNEIW